MFSIDAPSNSFSKDRLDSSYAYQTVYNWGSELINYPKTATGVRAPIHLDEWHTYSVEFYPDEIRLFIDDCLRHVIKEGDPVIINNDGSTRAFKIPKNQKYRIYIGNPVSGAGMSYWPEWYKAGNGQPNARPDFKKTIMEVDYVRYYKYVPLDGAYEPESTNPTKPTSQPTTVKVSTKPIVAPYNKGVPMFLLDPNLKKKLEEIESQDLKSSKSAPVSK